MLFTGTFVRSIDEKLRVTLPKRLREVAGSADSGGLYVAPGNDGSLAIYTEGAIERLAERLARTSPTQQEVRDFTRLFYARTQRVELDRQGRIRIPADLAQLAELTGEVVLLGVQDHVELWSVSRWEAYLTEKQARYDQIAEAAFGGLA